MMRTGMRRRSTVSDGPRDRRQLRALVFDCLVVVVGAVVVVVDFLVVVVVVVIVAPPPASPQPGLGPRALLRQD